MTYKSGRLPHPFPRHGVHTEVERTSSYTAVTYRGTMVLTVYPADRTFTIRTNGWETPTTKSRINDGLAYAGIPAHVYQKNFTWFLSRDGRPDVPLECHTEYPYGVPWTGPDLR